MTLFGKQVLCLFALMTSSFLAVTVCAETAPGAPCGPQDYDGEAPPDFTCPGPEEAALSVDLDAPRSVSVRVGFKILDEEGQELLTLAWEGAVVHRNRMVEVGMRTHAVRRLRWADRLRLRREYNIRLQHQSDVAHARLDLIEEQRNAYREQARQANRRANTAHAWWRSPALWFAIGVIVAGVLVALTAYGLSSVGG